MKSFKSHKYNSYEEYINQQCEHSRSMYRTARKSYSVYYDRIISDFPEIDIKNMLCVGARDPSEVNFFRSKGINTLGIEHSVDPELVLKSMRKISKYGAFIVLPLHEAPHKKDPIVFNFMEKAGDERDTLVTVEDVQSDFQSILGDTCLIKNFVQLPLLPATEDGFWFSVDWRK